VLFLFQEAESKSEESTASGASKSGKRNVKPVDPDPHGQKLIQVVVYFICKMYCGRHHNCIMSFNRG